MINTETRETPQLYGLLAPKTTVYATVIKPSRKDRLEATNGCKAKILIWLKIITGFEKKVTDASQKYYGYIKSQSPILKEH